MVHTMKVLIGCPSPSYEPQRPRAEMKLLGLDFATLHSHVSKQLSSFLLMLMSTHNNTHTLLP